MAELACFWGSNSDTLVSASMPKKGRVEATRLEAYNGQVTDAGGAIAEPAFGALLGYAMFVASHTHRLSVLSFRNNCRLVMADQL